jgi:hypothetical protein
VRHRAVKGWDDDACCSLRGRSTENGTVSEMSIAKSMASNLPHSTIKEEAFSLTGEVSAKAHLLEEGCGSHPKMSYRMATISRRMTEAAVFPF